MPSQSHRPLFTSKRQHKDMAGFQLPLVLRCVLCHPISKVCFLPSCSLPPAHLVPKCFGQDGMTVFDAVEAFQLHGSEKSKTGTFLEMGENQWIWEEEKLKGKILEKKAKRKDKNLSSTKKPGNIKILNQCLLNALY